MKSFKQFFIFASLAAFWLSQAQAAPTVFNRGVVNGASYMPTSMPGGGIAQGSFFSGFGTEMGPVAGTASTALPLPTELGGVRVTVTSGETTYNAFLTFVSAGQFNAVMPSEVPVGPAQVRVVFNGETSAAVAVQVVASGFGIFSVRSTGNGPGSITNFVSEAEQPVNSSSVTAAPGQVLTIWGTGLIGTPGADDISPLEAGAVGDRRGAVDVEVLIAGKPVAGILYAGRSAEFPGIDQISVQLAEDSAAGCFVPVLVLLNGVPSNEVTIAVGDEPGPCEDPLNPMSSALISGANLAALANVRLQGRVSLSPAVNIPFTLDVFAGSLSEQTGDAFTYNRFYSLPPLGSCSRQVFPGVNLVGLLGGDFPDLDFGTELDGGPGMTLTRNGGSERSIEQDPASLGRYVETVGGGFALIGTPPPAYYDPGEYRIVSPGGPEVGAFDVTFTIPERPSWVNRDAVIAAPVSLTQPLAFTWESGDAENPQIMLVFAANVDLESEVAGGFLCVVPQTPGGVTVPAQMMATVPPTGPLTPAGPSTLGFVGVGSLPVIKSFTAEGLDLGVAIAATLELQSVSFQ